MPSLFPVLDPAGAIGLAERGLMLHAVEFMLIVAIPVYILLFFFAYRYRVGNKKAKYAPDVEHGKLEELVWWVVPLEIVLVLGALTWGSTHQLDHKRALEGGPPLQVQVVALDWKWLFIYPQQGIATVNYLVMPTNRPVRFSITADAPMNSFWIPALGGQIYAMTGMATELNLVANEPGVYKGAGANYSGDGFAKMKFVASAVPEADFDAWVAGIKAATGTLSYPAYQELARPTIAEAPSYYAAVEPGLFDAVIMQFMDELSPIHH
ncbi:MAG: ubiquinol oxidase subunit II [Candidatus Pacebacteria bacterium]|nr:ubiquinol oxidase subunit II [Candidatus Paceibacterota bacterium]